MKTRWLNCIKYFLLLLVMTATTEGMQAQRPNQLDFNGQLVGWTTMAFGDPLLVQPGARFVPTLTGQLGLDKSNYLDFEASLNINGSVTWSDWSHSDDNFQFKPYRIWGRLAGENYELRAGLQKINFGSARMFRPLMWFDGMDVRDPLQLTDGVYALLTKYYFENNANIWLWGLMGNKNPKGFEIFGSVPNRPELGGRVELPLGPGEIGLSYHHRTLSYSHNRLGVLLPDIQQEENRFGFNGKWDVVVGLWLEGSVSLSGVSPLSSVYIPPNSDMINVGADYTLPVGNGLGVTLEYFRYHTGDRLFTGGVAAQLLGTQLTYPLTMLDNVSAMVFYMPSTGGDMLLNYFSWSRMYDNLSIFLMLFWNPDSYSIPAFQSGNSNLFAGKGFQLMFSYNF